MLLCLILLTTGMSGFAQGSTTITIGTGTNDSYNLPINNYYNNSWSEMIYPASDITERGHITSIGFDVSAVASGYQCNTITIYMGTTANEAHSSNSDWLPMDALTEVWSATDWPLPTTTGWLTFDLDNPFLYDGNDNLVIVISKTMPNYTNGLKFRYTTGISNCCLRRQNDNNVSYADHPSGNTGTLSAQLPNLQLTFSTTTDFCHSVRNLTVSDVTSSEATFSWAAPVNVSDFVLQYKTQNEDWEDGTAVTVYPSTTTYTLTNLTPNTYYDVRVANICDNGNSAWKSLTFKTECAVFISVSENPYYETFEGYVEYTFPDCWTRISGYSTGTREYPYISNLSSSSHDGNGFLYVYNNAANPTIMALPRFEEDLNTLRLSFWMKPTGTNSDYGRMELGVMTDLSDSSTFTLFHSWSAEEIGSTNWAYYELDLDTMINGGNSNLVFRCYVAGTSWYGWYFDDVKVMPIPDCESPREISTLPHSYSADLTWDDMTGTYNIYYKADTEDDYSSVNNVTVTDNGYELGNLAPETTYYVYVAAVCEDGSEAPSSSSIIFTTLCAHEATPYSEDFNAGNTIPNCWERYIGLVSDAFAGINPTPTTSGWVFNKTYTFGEYHPKVNIYGSYCKYWLISPAIDLSGLGDPALTFDIALTRYNNDTPIADPTSQADDRFLVLISTDDGATWSADNSIEWNNSGTGDYIFNQIPATGSEITIPLEQYAGQTVRIAFYGESTEYNGDNDLHIDNVIVGEVPTCPRPVQLAASNITTHSTEISWVRKGTEASWVVEYGPSGFTSGSGTTINVSGEPKTTLIGLTPSTYYEFHVKADCGAGDFSDPKSATFRTADCEALTTPFTEDFENYTTNTSTSTGIDPTCWELVQEDVAMTDATRPQLYYTSTFAHSGNYCLKMHNRGIYAMPTLSENIAIKDVKLEMYLRQANAAYQLQVGVWDDEEGTFVPVATFNNSTTEVEHVECDFSNYTGGGHRIAFRNVLGGGKTWDYSYNYIDDITLTEIPLTPTALPYFTDFSEEDDQNWLLRNGNCVNRWMIDTPDENTPSALFITQDGSTASYNISNSSTVMAEKAFFMPSTDFVHVEFDVQVGGDNYYDFLKVFLTPIEEMFEAGTNHNTQSNASYSTSALDFTDYKSLTGNSIYPYMLNLTNGNMLHVSANMPNPNPNGTGKIVFLWRNDNYTGTQPGVVVTNFSIEEFTNENLLPPTVTTDYFYNITTNSAECHGNVTDNGGASLTARGVCFNTTPNPTLEDGYVVVSGSGLGEFSSQLTGLSQGTTYYVRAYATNLIGTSYGEEGSFTTDCGALTLPYSDDFDSYTTDTTVATGIEPGCWTLMQEDVSMIDENRPQLIYNSDYTHSGDYSLRLKYRGVYVMPEMAANIAMNRVHLEMYLKQPKTYYALEVGVWEDDGTFVPVATFNNSTTGMERVECDFSNYTGNGRRIAFHNIPVGNNIYNYSYNFIDDIVLNDIAMVPVALPYSTNFGENANLNWLFNNGSCTNYWTMGSPDENTPSALFVTQDGGSANYNIWRGSTVMVEKAFLMPADDLVHVEFDVLAGGEQLNTSYAAPYDYLKVFLTTVEETFIPTVGSGSSGNTQSHTSYNTNALNFSDYKSQTSGNINYPYLLNLTNGNTIHVSTSLQNPNPSGPGKIVFLWRNDQQDGTQPGAVITNFSIEEAVVYPPAVTTGDISDVTANAATCGGNVTDNGGLTVTERGVCWSTSPNPTLEDAHTVNGNGLGEFVSNLTNLSLGVTYYIRAYATNGAGTGYGEEVSFSACDPITQLPYTEDFESYTESTTAATGVEPTCWELVQEDVQMPENKRPQLYYKSAFAHSGNYSLKMDYRGIYAMPALSENIAVKHVKLEMYLRQPNAAYRLQVGIWDDETGTFTPVATFNNSTTEVEHVECDFADYTGNGRRIAFRNTLGNGANFDYSYNYIDDITLTETDGCPLTIAMHSTYSNGWGGNKIRIHTDESVKEVTLETGYDKTETVTVHDGSLELEWVNGSYSSSRCSFTITGPMCFYYSGEMPVQGVFHTMEVDCSNGITAAPAFSYTTEDVCNSVIVHFENNSTEAENIVWDFGDGTTSKEFAPTHKYQESGTYEVTLSVNNNACEEWHSVTQNVAVTMPEPFTISIPYSDNFDSYTTDTAVATGVEPTCWELVQEDVAMTDENRPQLIHNNNHTHSGDYSLQLEYRGIYAMPLLSDDITLKHVKLEMYLKQPSSYYALEVGVWEDDGTFVPVATFNNSTTELEHVECDFSNYTGTSRRIAFHNILVGDNLYDYSYNFIDDLVLTETEGCELSIEMHDLYNDGWTGNKIRIHNDGTEKEVTLSSGSEATATVKVHSGPIALEWVNGQYPNDCSFTVSGPCLYYQAESVPAAGVFYETDLDCNSNGTPAAPAFTWWTENTCNSVLVHFENESADAEFAIWDFGDGAGSNEYSPAHEYTSDGTYPVTMFAYNSACGNPNDVTNFVTVTMPEPLGGDTTEFTICYREFPQYWYDLEINEAGVYTTVIEASNGCDSIVTCSISVTSPITIPYSEDFESYTESTIAATGIEPTCWGLVQRDVQMPDNKRPQLYYKSDFAHSGNYSLKMEYRGVYAMPYLSEDLAMKHVHLEMYLRQPNAIYQLQVGVWDDETGTFEPITTFNNSTTNVEHVECDFSEYNGNGRRIAFRNVLGNNKNYDYSYNYIDDIVLTESEGCATLTFEMHDSYGDGWNGNTIRVHTDGIVKDVTLEDGADGTAIVQVYNGLIELEWTYGGWPEECTFSVSGPCLYYSGDASEDGIFFSKEIDCNNTGIPAAPAFSYWTESTCNSVLVHFENESTDAESALWDFGDGTTSEELAPTHEYTESGDYHVTLSVNNNECESWNSMTSDILVDMPEPVIVTLPYSEDFESYTISTTAATGVEPRCWELVQEDVPMPDDKRPQLYYRSDFAHSGDYSLLMNYRGVYAMPPLDENTAMKHVHLEMYLRQPKAPYRLQVGVWDDETSTFTPVATINNSTTEVEHVECDFSNYTGNGRRIAFRNVLGSGSYAYSYNYIDDIVLTETEGCELTVENNNWWWNEAWNGGSKIRIHNDGSVKEVSFENETGGTKTVIVHSGPIELEWMNGYYPYDCDFTITGPSCFYYSGTAPEEEGVFLTTEIDCNNNGVQAIPNEISYWMENTCNGVLVHFDNVSNNAENAVWDFGDGTTSEELAPTHEYTESGDYHVTVSVNNNECENWNSTTFDVWVTMPEPVFSILDTIVYADALPMTWHGQTFTETSSFTSVLQAANGCDSTVIISVRVIPENDAQPCPGTPTVTDIEGNVYNTVQIGNQCWMRENLRATKKADSTDLLFNELSYSDPCYYDYESSDLPLEKRGYLYNWLAAKAVCPTGWHLPSEMDWIKLTDYLGSVNAYVCDDNTNNIAKALASKEGWNMAGEICYPGNSNTYLNNASGFGAVPAGRYIGNYNNSGLYSNFWSSSRYVSNYFMSFCLSYFESEALLGFNEYDYGLSVRCIQNDTNCAVITLPYVEDFETYTESTTVSTGVEPTCWELVQEEVQMPDSKRPQLYYKSDFAHSGDYSLLLNYRGVYAMPKLSDGITVNQVRLDMYLRQAKAVYQLEVGIWDDVEETFVPVVTFNNSTSEVEHVECDFSNYTGNGRRIAFRNVLGGGANYAYSYNYIDDITLTAEIPAGDAQPCPGHETVTDIDGNVYNTVKIGEQCWMKENLRTAHYADGTYITIIQKTTGDTYDWAYRCSPNNDDNTVNLYGYLYNWTAVMHESPTSSANPSGVQGICPIGWHVPSQAEWTQLIDYVENTPAYQCGNTISYIAKALSSTIGWNSSGGGCSVGNYSFLNNVTGFDAVPAGDGEYGLGLWTEFWSATESGNYALERYMDYVSSCVGQFIQHKGNAASVRCLRDNIEVAVVTTSTVYNVTTNSAICGGNVIADGGAEVTERGVCWSTDPNPTVDGEHTSDGSGMGTFTSTLTNLVEGTTYYVRAYATNSAGTAYGNEMAFTTCGYISLPYTEDFESYITATPTVVLYEDFSAITDSNSYTITNSLDAYTQLSGWSGDWVYPSNGKVKIGKSSMNGYLQTPALNLSGNNGEFVVTFDAKAWPNDTTSLIVAINEVPYTVDGLSTSEFNTFSVPLTGGTSTTVIKFQGVQESHGRFFLDNVVVTSQFINADNNLTDSNNADSTTFPATTGIEPDCWTLVQEDVPMLDTTRPQLYYNSAFAHSGNSSLRLCNRGIYAMQSIKEDMPMRHVHLEMYLQQPDTAFQLEVGVWDDETSSFETVAMFNNSTTEMEFVACDFSEYTGNGHRIAFRNLNSNGDAYSYNYLDDIVLTETEGCTLTIENHSPSWEWGGGAKILVHTDGCVKEVTFENSEGEDGTATVTVYNGSLELEWVNGGYYGSCYFTVTGPSCLYYSGYPEPGIFLSTEIDCNNDDIPAVPAFSWWTESTCNSVMVHFENNSANAENAVWDFGDGTSSEEFAPIHEYTADGYGNYDVTLSVNNDACEDWHSLTNDMFFGMPEPIVITLHYTEDFESYTESTTVSTGVKPRCWDLVQEDVTMTDTTRPQLYYDSTFAHSGDYSLKLHDRGIYAMPPIKENLVMKHVHLEMFLRQPNADYQLEVGVWDEETNTFDPIATFNNSTSEVEYVECDFSNYTGNGHRIAFHNILDGDATYNHSYNYIDDITLDVQDGVPCLGTPTVTDHEGNIYNTVQIGNQCWTKENLRTSTSPSTGTNLISASDADYSYTGKQAHWYDNDAETYAPQNYGLLYNWNAAVDTFNTWYGETSVDTNSNNSVSIIYTGYLRGICPVGWHLPSDAEWTQLINYVENVPEYQCREIYIAKALASTIGWDTSFNLCSIGNNQSANNVANFCAVPAGCCTGSSFDAAGYFAPFWCATQYNSKDAFYYSITTWDSRMYSYSRNKNYGYSVRCILNDTNIANELNILTVTTDMITNVTLSSATCGGNITSDGGADVTERGVCWSTAPHPTIYNNHTVDGNGTGAFTSSITDLEQGITYFVRAYATNSVGTEYGEEVSFTTLAIPDGDAQPCAGTPIVTDVDGNVYNTVKIGKQCWMRENLRVTHYADSTLIPEGGDSTSYTKPYYYVNPNVNAAVYGYYYNWTAAMHLAPSSDANPSGVQGICPDGWHLPSETEWIQLTDHLNSVPAYLCNGEIDRVAKALASTEDWESNDYDCSVGNEQTLNNTSGFSAIPAGGYYGSSPGFFNDEYGTAVFWSSTEMNGEVARNRGIIGEFDIIAYYNNGKSIGYPVRCLRNNTLAFVNTKTVIYITSYSAKGRGFIIDDGGEEITARGICWSTHPNPTLDDNHTEESTGTGAFASLLTGLDQNTTYYVRAYATNSMGTTYGNEVSFTTTLASPAEDAQPCPGHETLTDYDGNIYNTVKIGEQCWMKENLRVTHYSNGEEIPADLFINNIYSTSPSRYTPGNNMSNVHDFGYLYNWAAVMHGASSSSANPSNVQGACPDGWHVPSEAEWVQLIDYVGSILAYRCDGDSNNTAKALASTEGWFSTEDYYDTENDDYDFSEDCNAGSYHIANNASGFSALPARAWYLGTASYSGIGDIGGSNYFETIFWSSSDNGTSAAACLLADYSNIVFQDYWDKIMAASVRCLRDEPELSNRNEVTEEPSTTPSSDDLASESADITSPLGIEESSNALVDVLVYPNPTRDFINVQCTMNNVQLEGIEVIDVYGKVVRTVVGAINDSPTQINVSGLAAGMYFVRVTTEKGVVTKPFVKR